MKTIFTFMAATILFSGIASAAKYEVQCDFKSEKNGYKVGRLNIDLDLDKKTATTKHIDADVDSALFVCEDSWKVLSATNANGKPQKTLVASGESVRGNNNAYVLLSGGNCDDTSYSIQIINGIEGDQTHAVFVVSWNSGEELSSFNANQCSALKK